MVIGVNGFRRMPTELSELIDVGEIVLARLQTLLAVACSKTVYFSVQCHCVVSNSRELRLKHDLTRTRTHELL